MRLIFSSSSHPELWISSLDEPKVLQMKKRACCGPGFNHEAPLIWPSGAHQDDEVGVSDSHRNWGGRNTLWPPFGLGKNPRSLRIWNGKVLGCVKRVRSCPSLCPPSRPRRSGWKFKKDGCGGRGGGVTRIGSNFHWLHGRMVCGRFPLGTFPAVITVITLLQ